ncbi:hypothetical protein ACTOV4_23505 [Brucella sp. C7-11G]
MVSFPHRKMSKVYKHSYSEQGARVMLAQEQRIRQKALRLGAYARKIRGQGWFLCNAPDDRHNFLLGPLIDHRLETALDLMLAGEKVHADFQ